MTKEQLIEENTALKEEIERLENDVDYWQAENEDKQDIIDELEEELANYEDYIDINNFIKRLKINNLYDDKIENFIEEYLRFYNK